MIRSIMAFLAIWGVVFFGLSYFWHTSRAEKLNMLLMAFYSFVTAMSAFAILAFIVVMF